MKNPIRCPALLWYGNAPAERWQCRLEAGHSGPHHQANVLGWLWTDGVAPTLAAQPPSATEVSCTAPWGVLACMRAAWHPGAHECGGVSWYSGDAPDGVADSVPITPAFADESREKTV